MTPQIKKNLEREIRKHRHLVIRFAVDWLGHYIPKARKPELNRNLDR
jgi:hypothetical protein